VNVLNNKKIKLVSQNINSKYKEIVCPVVKWGVTNISNYNGKSILSLSLATYGVLQEGCQTYRRIHHNLFLD
jgi:hypothetical protein